MIVFRGLLGRLAPDERRNGRLAEQPVPPGTFAAEMVGYILATLILVVGGMFVLGPILNWICGPAIVVACISLTTAINRFRNRTP